MNLKELAQTLGLSQTTVSRALNGYPEVSEETRNRVQAAAKSLNYTPNLRARRLATGRAMTIGHVIPVAGRHEQVNPFFADFIAGAGEVYGREGYDLLLSMVPEDKIAHSYRQLAANGAVDGIMVQAPHMIDMRMPLLRELKLPFLVHGRAEGSDDFSWLDIANVRAFRRATELLLDLGHRRIALINGPETLDYAARRRRGFSEALEARDLSPNPAWMRDGLMTEGFGHASAAAMLDSQPAPTAFLVSSIILAMGVQRAAADRGLKLGRDVSVVCHDDVLSYLGNTATASGGGPPFTATRSSIRLAGIRCAEILIDLIRNPGQPPVHELWEVELVIGRSTGPAPQG